MIRIRHEALPVGLSALMRRRADGDVEVVVSSALSPNRQRAAVRTALRAGRPAGRQHKLLPLPGVVLLALAGGWLRAIARVLRLHPAVAMTVTATTTAAATAALVIAVAPYHHGPAVASNAPATSGVPGPIPSRLPASQTPRPSATPAPSPASALPVAPSPIGLAGAPESSPSQQSSSGGASPTAPAPTPSARPSPTPSLTTHDGNNDEGDNDQGDRRDNCLKLLWIWVCP